MRPPKKPVFVGISKGGVNEYDWTTANPDKVSCIYADNPAIRPEAFVKLVELAKNDVALLNVCGSADFLLQRHTLPIENRYQQLGGRITVMIKDGAAHHPHSLKNAKPIADWIEQHMLLTESARPDFFGEKFIKTYYYSLKAEMQRDGQTVTVTGQIVVQPGQNLQAVLTEPTAKGTFVVTSGAGQ